MADPVVAPTIVEAPTLNFVWGGYAQFLGDDTTGALKDFSVRYSVEVKSGKDVKSAVEQEEFLWPFLTSSEKAALEAIWKRLKGRYIQ